MKYVSNLLDFTPTMEIKIRNDRFDVPKVPVPIIRE